MIGALDAATKKGTRDWEILSAMLGRGLRRSEATSLRVDHIQKCSHAWVLANVPGKRNKIRTVVIPDWTKTAIDAYLAAYEIS